MKKNILAQKGVVFGLDARLVLAILAIVSLGIALTKETQVKKDCERATKAKMEYIESKFLQEWERLRFLGYGDNAKADHPDFGVNVLDYGLLGFSFPSFHFSTISALRGNYVNPYNGIKMERRLILHNIENYYGMSAAALNIQLNLPEGGKFKFAGQDAYVRFLKIVSKYIDEEGRARISTVDDTLDGVSYNLITFDKDGFGEPIRVYMILDIPNTGGQNEYISHFILLSKGGNKILDSKLPKTLEDLKSFKAEGDDIFRIFSTKDIYLKAKAENLHRLKTIAEKIESMAESAYATKISDCSLASSVTSACDKNSDGVFDWKDKNILKNYNPYLKTKDDDTTGANYLNLYLYYTQFKFNSAALKNDAEKFVRDGLGLPKYLSYDLFGNILKYDSNVNKTTEGPYTMEVWY